MSKKRVLVIDYGMGNLGSVRRSLEEVGAEVVVEDSPSETTGIERIVLPGVGSFADGMAKLRDRGWIEFIRSKVTEGSVPLLGVCLGMQLLADRGFENGEHAGLGLIPGEVIKLKPDNENVRIPHVGWNEIYRTVDHPLLDQIPDGIDFYFVHSYHFSVKSPEVVLARTPYCGEFISAVSAGNVCGVQFHPEKSQKPGFQLLRNFLNLEV